MTSIVPHWENSTKQVIITEFGESYTWGDFYQVVNEVHHMVTSVDHQVDMIFCYAAGLPPGNPLVHFRKAFESQPTNVRQVVIVNQAIAPALQSFMKALSSILLKILPSKRQVIFAHSLDEAQKILAAKVV